MGYSPSPQGLPHVTDILRDVFPETINPFWTEEGRERGTEIHDAIRMWEEGLLDEDYMEPDTKIGLDCYREWFRHQQPEVLSREALLDVPALGYCGTPDCILKLNGRTGVLDVKSGAAEDWHGLQLAAYVLLAEHVMSRAMLVRWSLYLRPEKAVPYELKTWPLGADGLRDTDDWKAALRVYRRRHTWVR